MRKAIKVLKNFLKKETVKTATVFLVDSDNFIVSLEKIKPPPKKITSIILDLDDYFKDYLKQEEEQEIKKYWYIPKGKTKQEFIKKTLALLDTKGYEIIPVDADFKNGIFISKADLFIISKLWELADNPVIKKIYLFSGDSDFAEPIKKIKDKRSDIQFIIVSTNKALGVELRQVADKIILIEEILKEIFANGKTNQQINQQIEILKKKRRIRLA